MVLEVAGNLHGNPQQQAHNPEINEAVLDNALPVLGHARYVHKRNLFETAGLPKPHLNRAC